MTSRKSEMPTFPEMVKIAFTLFEKGTDQSEFRNLFGQVTGDKFYFLLTLDKKYPSLDIRAGLSLPEGEYGYIPFHELSLMKLRQFYDPCVGKRGKVPLASEINDYLSPV